MSMTGAASPGATRRVSDKSSASPVAPGSPGRWPEPPLPRCEGSGKTCFTFAVGCIGGRCGLVYVPERLAVPLRRAGWPIWLAQRDLPLRAASAPASADSAVPAID
jgi:hypothetical protein